MAARRAGWWVYVLRCGDGSLYTGATNDLTRRVERHARGKGGRYTRSRLPVVLVHSERAAGRGPALRREAALKRLSRAAKLALVGRGGAPGAPPGGRRAKGEPARARAGQGFAAAAAASSGKSLPRMKRVPSGIG